MNSIGSCTGWLAPAAISDRATTARNELLVTGQGLILTCTRQVDEKFYLINLSNLSLLS